MAKSPIIYNGKKEKLIPLISPLYPNTINNYYEPFCGGASIFFDLFSQQIINGDYYLSDLNWRILRIYEVIRDDISGLLADLTTHCPKASHSDLNFVMTAKMTKAKLEATPQWARLYEELERYFYHLRAVDDKYTAKKTVLARIGLYNPNYLAKVPKSKTEFASKDLFLNRMTKNGWREDQKSGKFNLPYFKKRTSTPNSYNAPTVLADCHKVFSDPRVHIKVEDYLKIEPRLVSGDFVYLDPPYEPASKTANFTSYTCNGFGQLEQRQLADFLNRIDGMGVRFILSNSLAASSLYTNPKFNIQQIKVKNYKPKSPPRYEILVNN